MLSREKFQPYRILKKCLNIEGLLRSETEFLGKFTAQNRKNEELVLMFRNERDIEERRKLLGWAVNNGFFKPSASGLKFLCGENLSRCLADETPERVCRDEIETEQNKVMWIPQSITQPVQEVRT
jgi:hypothetical protein